MLNQPEISIVVPLYNEEDMMSELVSRLNLLMENSSLSMEVVLINDGSTDRTEELARQVCLSDKRYQGVFLARNYGHQLALTAGIKHARGSKALFIIDGDLQDPPELFTEFYDKLNEGFDVVYAVRKKRKEGFFKKILYATFYRMLRRISYINIPLDSGDFSLITRRVADVLNKMPEQSRFIRGMRSWVGFKQVGVEYERQERFAGSTKYAFKDLLRLAYNGIFNFSTIPISFITRLGFLSIIGSVIYIGITIYRKLVFDDVPSGFTTQIIAIALFGGVQLVSLGVIGEYVLRIFFQVKGRPLYIVQDRLLEGEKSDIIL